VATVLIGSSPFTITSADVFPIGSGGANQPSTHVIQGVSAAFAGTGLIIKGRVIGSALAFTPIPYDRRNIASVASDDTVASAALTANFIIKVDSTGLDIAIDASAGGWSGGSMAIGYKILSGADA
jgi:hypothetical protein